MKSKLFIICLLATLVGLGQVPNTTNFTLQDVADEIGQDNLDDCFINSNPYYFNSAYGSHTMSPKTLYGFRDYGAPVYLVQDWTHSTSGYIYGMDISADGQYLFFLIFSSYTEQRIRRHTLSTPFDISTISLDFTERILSGLPTFSSYISGGFFISNDGTQFFFHHGQYLYVMTVITPYDVTTYSGHSGSVYEVKPSLEFVDVWASDTAIVETATQYVLSDYEIRGYDIPGPAKWIRGANGTLEQVGLEFHPSNTRYYSINREGDDCVLLKWSWPDHVVDVIIDLSSIVTLTPLDFCMTDDMEYMYIIAFDPVYGRRIYQFRLHRI